MKLRQLLSLLFVPLALMAGGRSLTPIMRTVGPDGKLVTIKAPEGLSPIETDEYMRSQVNALRRAPQHEADEPVGKWVNVKYVYNPEDGIVPDGIQMEGGFKGYYFRHESDEMQLFVRLETTILAAIFHQGPTLYYVVKELPDLKDGDTVVFDVAEAIHKISFRMFDSNGNMMSDSFAEEGTQDTLGNVGETYLWHKDKGIVISTFSRVFDEDGYFHDTYVNDFGPNFGFSAATVVKCWGPDVDWGDMRFVKWPVWSATDDIRGVPTEEFLDNDITTWNTYDSYFARQPRGFESEETRTQLFVYSPSFDGSTSYSPGAIVEEGEFMGYPLNPWVTYDYDFDGMKAIRYRVSVCGAPATWVGNDTYEIYLCDSVEEYPGYPDAMHGMPYFNTPNGREYLTYNSAGGFALDWFAPLAWTEDAMTDYGFLIFKNSVNPNLQFDDCQRSQILNNSCPLCCVWGIEYENYSPWIIEMGLSYIGRYGETREADWQLDLIDYEAIESETSVNHIFTNDNVLIDGKIEGLNVTENDILIGGEDLMCPTLQHLRFFDADGNINDRFDTPDEGTFEMYAADFYFDTNWKFAEGFFNYRPLAEVTVEYAPYGTDTFKPLTVTEVPEKFFMPGYGYYFTGTLADCDVKSLNGWFDMKVTLTDAAGNQQRQLVRPAFYVESLKGESSIEALPAAADNLRILRQADAFVAVGLDDVTRMSLYDLTGALVATAPGPRLPIAALPHGLYIVEIVTPNGRHTSKIAL